MSAADFLLAVYARWNQRLPVRIRLGSNVERLVDSVSARPAFREALAAAQAGWDPPEEGRPSSP